MSTTRRSVETGAASLARRYGWALVALIMVALFVAMLFPEGALGLSRRPALSGATPAVCFAPEYVEINTGVTQTVALMVYDIVDFRSIELLLHFDPAKIQIQDADPGQVGIQVGVGDVLAPTQTYTDGYLLQTVDNVAGTIDVHAAFAFEDPPFSGSGSLIVITFLGVGGGSSPWTFDTLWLSDSTGASINVDVCQSSVVVLDGTHTPEPTLTLTPTATVTPTQTPVPTAAIAIVPPHSELDVGTSVSVQVVVSDVVNLYGVAFELSFDPTLVQVVDADPGEPGVQITLGDFLSPNVVPSHVVDNAAGTIEIAFAQIAPSPPRTGSGAIASIEFVGADVGLSPLVFGDVDLGNSDGLSILAERVDGELLVVGENRATLVGSVSFQGRPASPHAHWISPLSVTLETTGGGSVSTYSPTTDATGVFTITSIVPGTYDIAVRDRNSLWNVRNGHVLAVGNNHVALGTLIAGDANLDEVIDVFDFSILANTYGTTSADLGWDPRADFNNSGEIAVFDFSLMASNFAKSGRTVLNP